jgi:hypothetical protein
MVANGAARGAAFRRSVNFAVAKVATSRPDVTMNF